MKTLILTVGLPCSGKTEAALCLGHPVVSIGALRRLLKLHPLVMGTAWLMVEALFAAGHTTVVVDDYHTKRRFRDYWRSSSWRRTFYQVTLYSPEERASLVCQTQENYRAMLTKIEKHRLEVEPILEHEHDN